MRERERERERDRQTDRQTDRQRHRDKERERERSEREREIRTSKWEVIRITTHYFTSVIHHCGHNNVVH